MALQVTEFSKLGDGVGKIRVVAADFVAQRLLAGPASRASFVARGHAVMECDGSEYSEMQRA